MKKMVKERPRKPFSYTEMAAKIYENETILVLSPQEAMIIDMSLKGAILSEIDYRWFLLALGESITKDIDVGIRVTGNDLWFLRAWVDPNIRIGGAKTGQDIVIKIYGLLISLWDSYRDNRMKEGLHEIKAPEVKEVEKNDDKDNTEDNTEDNTDNSSSPPC